jgi:acyl-CoA thioesterase I
MDRKVICLFGDSITYGVGDLDQGGWGARLKSYFETNNYDIALYNCGIRGDTTAGLLKRFDVEAEAREPNIIIIAIGINDSKYHGSKDQPEIPLEQFQNNFGALLEKAKKHASTLVCLGLTKVDEKRTMPCSWNTENYLDEENVRLYDKKVEESCKGAGVLFLSLYDILNVDELDDGLHPNPQGHKKIFSEVKDYLLSNNLV